jgi:hypothetical protein
VILQFAYDLPPGSGRRGIQWCEDIVEEVHRLESYELIRILKRMLVIKATGRDSAAASLVAADTLWDEWVAGGELGVGTDCAEATVSQVCTCTSQKPSFLHNAKHLSSAMHGPRLLPPWGAKQCIVTRRLSLNLPSEDCLGPERPHPSSPPRYRAHDRARNHGGQTHRRPRAGSVPSILGAAA